MGVQIEKLHVKSILIRTSGYLDSVCSHSLQPYRGCSYGRSLCGVGCYVQHNYFGTRGREWGTFLEAKGNAAEVYSRQFEAEKAWAQHTKGRFSIFMSSSTDPFVSQERRFGITRQLLHAMLRQPPDVLIVQTHSHLVTAYLELYQKLAPRCDLRFHISIESDRERLPGLPPPASSVAARFEAALQLKKAGLRVVITVAPILPIADPDRFFGKIATVADAVVLDHFIEGDGSKSGSRTLKTALPAAMQQVAAESVSLSYRRHVQRVAQKIMPGRVGIGMAGFAGHFQ